MSFAGPDDTRLVFLPFDQVHAGKGHCDVIRDCWWVVDPERGLLFYQRNRSGKLRSASPQCNRNESIARSIQRRLYPWAEVRQVPLVMLPINVSDYA